MAQALPPPAPAIVITGRALPEAQAERAYAIERFDRSRIERSPTRELDQLLKEVPGLQLFRRSDARSGHPTSQGVTLRALGGNASSRALLMLDGVPQTDPFGGWINWPAYDPASVAEIRVVRGGGSVANGPGALAGTIEMEGRADRTAAGGLDLGSRQSVDGRGYAGVAVGEGLLALSGSGSRSDGFVPVTDKTRGPADERAPYRQWNGRGRFVAPLSRTTEIQANLSGFRDWRTRGTEFSDNRTKGADASLRLVGRGGWKWSALGYSQWRNFRSSFASLNHDRSIATRVSLQDSVPSHGLGGSFELRPPISEAIELRFGADTRRTDGETRELFAYSAGEPTRRRVAGGQTSTVGAFAEASAKLGAATITGGARLDHWRVSDGSLLERVIASGATLRDERFDTRSGWLPTGRAGVVAPLSAYVSLRSAAYLGWRMPTLNELFRPFRAGADATAANAELDPETLAGAEAGLDYSHGPFRISVTGFVNRLRDAIANVTLGEGPGTFPGVGFVGAGGLYRQRQNIDAVKVHGIEASARWARGPWSLSAATSWAHARVSADGSATPLDGLRPAQTPKFAATLTGGFDDNGKSAELVIRRVGPQFEDDLNSRTLKGATTLDASAAWPISRRLQLLVRAENLFDTLVIAGIGGDGAVERATPQTLWVGLRLK